MSDFVPSPHDGWVSIELQGTTELRRKARVFQTEIDDFGPLWDSLTNVMIEHELDWFASEGEGSWPPLSPKYEARKVREGFEPETLVRTEVLLESLTTPGAAEVGQGRTTAGTFAGNTFSWGTDDETAEYHTTGRDDMPPRPPLVLTSKLRERVRQEAEDFLSETLILSGFREEGA